MEKVRDIVGLYMNPPENALVLCVDEKSQVQALNRTQPILPLGPGVPAQQSHDYDYERHGVTSLFTALNARTGTTNAACHRRHRHGEFLRFLNKINESVRAGVHIVMDNYGTHKMARVRQWSAGARHS